MLEGDQPNLPWHIQAGMHVYVWAGGERVRRMHLANYKELMRGHPAVATEELTAEHWTTVDDFEKACIEYEEEVTRQTVGWRLHPANTTKK